MFWLSNRCVKWATFTRVIYRGYAEPDTVTSSEYSRYYPKMSGNIFK